MMKKKRKKKKNRGKEWTGVEIREILSTATPTQSPNHKTKKKTTYANNSR